jgi:uncharacterized membrane protein
MNKNTFQYVHIWLIEITLTFKKNQFVDTCHTYRHRSIYIITNHINTFQSLKKNCEYRQKHKTFQYAYISLIEIISI